MVRELDLVNIYSFITPIAIFLILAEVLYCLIQKKNYINFQDAVTNLGTAIGNQCVNLLVAYVVVIGLGWLYQYRFFTVPTTLFNFIVLLILFDFFFYWFHRHGHSTNILWAAHMPHHSSEEMNLFVATRASITQRLFSFFYMWPLVFLGFSPEAIYAASAVQLLIAFWHHTRTIGKMGWFEILFNSPSYHRVHHAMNEKYLDKNFGEIFIIWDKLFGTYMPEEEEPVYGALTPVESWNPNRIYFHWWAFLWDDCVKTKSWWDKIRLWFMPLGWRPEDRRNVQRKRVNAKDLVKYKTPLKQSSKYYLIFQIVMGILLMYVTINQNFPLTAIERLVLSLTLWLMITNWGGILENRPWVVHTDLIFITVSTGLIFYFGPRFLSGVRSEMVSIVGLLFLNHFLWRNLAFKEELRREVLTE